MGLKTQSKKASITSHEERVILADVLPYEVPPYFSNRYFYEFLVKYKVRLKDSHLIYKDTGDTIIHSVIRLIFGLPLSLRCEIEGDTAKIKVDEKTNMCIPYNFKISHKKQEFRELSVIHPFSQLQVIEFYRRFNYTLLSENRFHNYSLRSPFKIANTKYFKDSIYKRKYSGNDFFEIVETSEKEYNSLKTYFSYRKYSNIYKFYESHLFQKAEKKFNILLKFDIARCFDSIYTHSLSWALANKRIVKENVGRFPEEFANRFDNLMQKMNYNETNGIVIGPEFSRIFAELILQCIDKQVYISLKNAKKYEKADYEIYRYVDDYFIFCSDQTLEDEILRLYKSELKKYNFFINEIKTQRFVKPVITNISIAKEHISSLVNRVNFFHVSSLPPDSQTIYYSSKDVITKYKSILKMTDTSYKDLQNYFLAIIFNRIVNILDKYKSLQKRYINSTQKLIDEKKKGKKLKNKKRKKKIKKLSKKCEKLAKEISSVQAGLHNKVKNIIELVFFVYSVLPRISYAIKLCHILYRIVDFYKNQESNRQSFLTKRKEFQNLAIIFAFKLDQKHLIYKIIYDGIKMNLSKNRKVSYCEIESTYLLSVIKELGKHYQFSDGLLNRYFLEDKVKIDYFALSAILNYICDSSEYPNTRDRVNELIDEKLKVFNWRRAEDVFLIVEIICNKNFKPKTSSKEEYLRKILTNIKFFGDGTENIKKLEIIGALTKFQSNWFFNRENNLGIELNTKRGHQVY